jgi:oligopeptide transport system substrate-binding protein
MRKTWKFLTAATIMAAVISCQKTFSESQKGEKVLKINVSREPTSLDPRKLFDPSHHAILSMLFEGLVRLNPDLSIELAQAKSFLISSDRLTYTFFLQKAKWSNGEPVKAGDYVSTWLDLLDPLFPAPNAHLLYDVRGAQLAKAGQIPLREVGIKALDDETIQIVLERPNPAFLQILASPMLFPVCQPHAKKQPNWAQSAAHFVGNGPFSIAHWQPQHELALHRNPQYKGRFPASLETIQISLIDNETSALHLYASGQLDLIGSPLSHIPLPYIKELAKQETLQTLPVAATLYCAFNTAAYPFNSKNLRKALSLAIRRREITEHITGQGEEVGTTFIPPILMEGSSLPVIEEGDGSEARHYLQLALQEMGVKLRELSGLTLYYWPLEVNFHIAQTLQQQWLDVLGLHVNIEVIDFKSLLAKVQDKSYQMALFAWSAEYADPMALLERFRLANDAKNYPLWSSEALNETLDRAALEINRERRLTLFHEAEKILAEEMPLAPLFHWNHSFLIQPSVRDFTMNPLGQIYFDRIKNAS